MSHKRTALQLSTTGNFKQHQLQDYDCAWHYYGKLLLMPATLSRFKFVKILINIYAIIVYNLLQTKNMHINTVL